MAETEAEFVERMAKAWRRQWTPEEINLVLALARRGAAAEFLFGLLDDIDTADDMAKGNETVYREMVRNIHRRRFEVASTDGYRVTFLPSPPAGGPVMSEIVLPTLGEMAVLKHQIEIISATYSEKLKQVETEVIACRARIEQLEAREKDLTLEGLALIGRIEATREALAGTDIGSLPNDYPLERMAADRMVRIQQLEARLRFWCKAHEAQQAELFFVAYESTRATLGEKE